MRLTSTMLMLLWISVEGIFAQEPSDFIVIDQFGYLPESKKVAVIRNPQVGFDAGDSFTPGTWYTVVNASSGETVYGARPVIWGDGITDASSGDMAWHFDFSEVSEPGTYYILDSEQELRSFEFVIAHDVFNEVLKQAMRTFYYQRAGFSKEVPYAEAAWEDGASHVGDLQDNNCRSFFDKFNPATERDVSGGWYDAGDYNKYTNWTANYVVELVKAYKEKPDAWADDYQIPESGNGIPDILDECIWGVDHLLRLQLEDGSVLSIVGEDHASPPSAATGPSYYGPPSTSATLNTSAAFAIASGVFWDQGLTDYADTLLARALLAWEWAELYPDSLFNNNDPAYESLTLGAGRQEEDEYGRAMAKLEAACYLFGETGDAQFRDYFDNHYQDVHLFQWTWAFPFEALNQEIPLYYTTLEQATVSVVENIKSVYRTAVVNGEDNMDAYVQGKDPYLAHTNTYTWGSNGVKSSQGSMNYNLITYGMDDGITTLAADASEVFIHNLHGVNPLNFVYLSNMYAFGAEKGVNEFYHSWFSNGSTDWDRVGTSTYGPAPGFLTGGPNPGYDRDGCCPSGCGSSANNAKCSSESISPPKNQPPQKSYKDFNTSWPINSWSVTENSCGYQVRYIRLLSKFVTAGMDCNGEVDGGAFIDSCGVCAGGSTGIIPSLDPNDCEADPDPPPGDTMYIEGRHLYTAAGEKVILRGVNEMFVWSGDKTGTRLIPQIAKTGANCVRLVWTEEYGHKSQLVELIERCIDHKMIAMPESHDATGEWADLDICINFWNDPVLRDGIQRNKRWTLVNIGNEVGDGSVSAAQFKAGYKRAIDSLRGWGYTVPLVIDASKWGQDVDNVIATWQEIEAHDPLHNIMFSVHSYWSGTNDYYRVANESKNNGAPLIIGEGPSPTAYPTCQIKDYKTGLTVTGENEIGWLSWSWGGLANGHCVPNFDHTSNGVFGQWRTSHARIMMADHAYSLLRTAERPASFFEAGLVPPAGIYYAPDVKEMTIGDTLEVEVLVTPGNAENKGYRFEMSGDTTVVSFERGSGKLAALSPGIFYLNAISDHNPSIFFSRRIEVKAIAVTDVLIHPAEASLFMGDTLFLEVEVLPTDATVKDYYFEVSDTASAISLDEETGRVIALNPGSAIIKAISAAGGVSGEMVITVSKIVGIEEDLTSDHFKIYPNPNEGMLYVTGPAIGTYTLSVYDSNGSLVFRNDFSGKGLVDTAGFASGSYLVVQEYEGRIFRHKLLKH